MLLKYNNIGNTNWKNSHIKMTINFNKIWNDSLYKRISLHKIKNLKLFVVIKYVQHYF